jgi:hypothetical protein
MTLNGDSKTSQHDWTSCLPEINSNGRFSKESMTAMVQTIMKQLQQLGYLALHPSDPRSTNANWEHSSVIVREALRLWILAFLNITTLESLQIQTISLTEFVEVFVKYEQLIKDAGMASWNLQPLHCVWLFYMITRPRRNPLVDDKPNVTTKAESSNAKNEAVTLVELAIAMIWLGPPWLKDKNIPPAPLAIRYIYSHVFDINRDNVREFHKFQPHQWFLGFASRSTAAAMLAKNLGPWYRLGEVRMEYIYILFLLLFG